MGEYADLESEREQRAFARRALAHATTRTPAQRADEAARGRVAGTAALEAYRAELAPHAEDMTSAGVVVTVNGRGLQAARGLSILGRWYPHKRGEVSGRNVKCVTPLQWLALVLLPRSGKLARHVVR